jgi:hypothetical protein
MESTQYLRRTSSNDVNMMIRSPTIIVVSSVQRQMLGNSSTGEDNGGNINTGWEQNGDITVLLLVLSIIFGYV